MNTATITPLDSNHLIVKMPGQEVVIDAEQGPAMMAALKGQATVVVNLKGNGFRLDSANTDAALDFAGLSSFQAAKQTATGRIEF